MTKLLSFTLLFLILFTGCSSKKYFEPEDTISFKSDSLDLEASIIDLNANGATLENYTYVSKKGVHTHTKEGYTFLNYIDNTILSADDNASIHIKNKNLDEVISFDKNIISASKSKNLLAFGSMDNSIVLYDLNTKQVLFKEYLQTSVVNNIKITNPVFLNTVILYPTLDGKVVIVDIKNKSIVKTINIDPKSDVNNIIFLQEIDDALVAATSKKLFTFIEGKANIKDVEVQNIIIKDDFIYVATLDGRILKYDTSLNILASKKFKFAKINALAFGKNLYALESQGYLIKISPDFTDVIIYDFSFDNEEKVIGIDDKIYFEDEYIIVE